MASRSSVRATRPVYTRWYGLIGIVMGAVALTFLLRAFVVEPFRVPANSMAPSVPIESYVLVSKWGYGHYGAYGISLMHRPRTAPLARADLIVFDYPVRPERSYIKRLIGLPGDRVVYRDKRLTINGVPVRTTEIGTNSLDSRYWGFVPESAVIGKISHVFVPEK